MSRLRAAEPRPAERALENSESEFTERYAAYAAPGELYPGREGSPLLEFASGGRVLYLFDRTGPYTAPPGPARVIVHGILTPGSVQPAAQPAEVLSVQGISAVEGTGRVVQVIGRTWVVQARVTLVLSAFDPLPQAAPGEWFSFRTEPPLHGFVLRGT